MYCIAFNGPPRAGKDSIATRIQQYVDGTHVLPTIQAPMSMPMRLRVYAFLGIPYTREHYEQWKDEPLDALDGRTIRQFMIQDSEVGVKPFLGETAWALAAMNRLGLAAFLLPGLCLIPDAGFGAEQLHVQGRFGPNNYLLVRVLREGHDFTGDSRSYLESPGFVNTLDVVNEYGRLDHVAHFVLDHTRKVLDWDV